MYIFDYISFTGIYCIASLAINDLVMQDQDPVSQSQGHENISRARPRHGA